MSSNDEQNLLKTPLANTDNALPPDFDAGINTSAAWTESRDKSHSLSDEETDPNDPELDYLQVPGRPARALYSFEGKPEFREVCVSAGDEIEVTREEVGDGWSLVKVFIKGGVELGLLPRSYYTFTADFASPFHNRREPEASGSSITPRGSPKQDPQPIVPQHTGEWFPSFRRSLMGGKSLNRFSSFVTSGAEEWVLKGAPEDRPPPSAHHRLTSEPDEVVETTLSKLGVAEEDMHYVDEGPSWKMKLPPFRILVHSPAKRVSPLTGSYTVYSVTSLFRQLDSEDSETESHRVTVQRRFSHFVALHTALSRRLPGIALPPLPDKQYAGRFSEAFIEARRGDLERYIGRIVRHPIARYGEVLTFFLSCEDDIEWKRGMPKYINMPPAGPSFYAHVFHPAYNLDTEELAETGHRFANHTRAVGKGVQGLRNVFSQVRQARVEMSRAERLLSYSFLSLITSKPLASPSTTIAEDEEDETLPQTDKGKGTMNSDGAWWEIKRQDCLKLTKSMQKAADALQSVADSYDDHARRTQLVTHEALKGVSHPYTVYAPILDTHLSTVTRHHEALASASDAHEEISARCETVLNTTMAEMETYHSQKIEDFEALTKEHLDGEIQLYEQILSKLKTARGNFDEPLYGSLAQTPRQPSIYERELENPRLANPPLTQPTPHVFDSAPMRPVSVAIQEGVGLFLNAPRSSVFGKFW